MTKRAVVAGINNYSNWNAVGFSNLSWCLSDAQSFAQDILVDGRGFRPDDVTMLLDRDATRVNILEHLRRTLARADLGDVICFYFSGHGDRNPMPGRPSEWYETIVPFDGAAMISDQEINRLIAGLEFGRLNVTFVFDSCHSGGVYDPAPPEGSRVAKWAEDKLKRLMETCRTIIPTVCAQSVEPFVNNIQSVIRVADAVTMTVDGSKDTSDTAKATLFSACGFDETAKEKAALRHGFMTKALLDTVNQSEFKMSNAQLANELRTKVGAFVTQFGTSKQTPRLRGRPIRQEETFLTEWTFSI